MLTCTNCVGSPLFSLVKLKIRLEVNSIVFFYSETDDIKFLKFTDIFHTYVFCVFVLFFPSKSQFMIAFASFVQ